jgi:hypothetical protein
MRISTLCAISQISEPIVAQQRKQNQPPTESPDACGLQEKLARQGFGASVFQLPLIQAFLAAIYDRGRMLKTVIDLARIARARMNGSPPAMPTARYWRWWTANEWCCAYASR